MIKVFKKRVSATHKRGFTLIEVLVYLAVLVLVASAGVSTFLSLDTVLIRNQTERELTQSAEVTLERMLRDIRRATAADVTIGSQLTLTSLGTTTVFSLSGGNVIVNVNGAELGPLTTDDVTVQSLTFSKYVDIAAEIETDLVRVALTLTATSSAA